MRENKKLQKVRQWERIKRIDDRLRREENEEIKQQPHNLKLSNQATNRKRLRNS